MDCKVSKNKQFTNWGNHFHCTPELYFEPKNVSEIQQVVEEARQNGKCVRAVGNGHSLSDIACTTDYMVSLSKMNKILDVNTEDNTVLAEAGILIEDLNESLYNSGLALSLQGAVSDVSLAGAFSTGTHFSGRQYGILSSFVTALEIVTASGNVEFISKNDDEEKFKAFALNLGALGIITKVRIQCEPRFNLKVTSYGASRKDAIDDLEVHLKTSEHFLFTWYPNTDQCILHHISRTHESCSRKKESWFWGRFVTRILLEFLLWICLWIPCLVPFVEAMYFRLSSARCVKVDRSYNIFNFGCSRIMLMHAMEFAFPIKNTGSVLAELRSWLKSSGFKAHFNLDVRFVRADDIYLSPAYNQDSCYINVCYLKPYNTAGDHAEYWRAVKSIMLKHGGRPHWAKDHSMTSKELQPLYPKWDEFARVRKSYDPKGMFMNESLRRTLGDN